MYVLIVLLKEWKPQHHRFNNAKNSKQVRTIYNEVEFLRNLREGAGSLEITVMLD